jgi:hypothetical protein
VKGPTQSVLVREKEKVAGIWVNADRMRYRSAPSFYAVASSKPIDRLVDDRTRAIYELGRRQPAAFARVERAARRAAALRQRAGRPQRALGPLLRSARRGRDHRRRALPRPRSTSRRACRSGRFTAETFLIRDGRVLAAAVRADRHPQIGVRALRRDRAERHSLLYGLVAVALSVLFGWGAARSGGDSSRGGTHPIFTSVSQGAQYREHSDGRPFGARNVRARDAAFPDAHAVRAALGADRQLCSRSPVRRAR